MCFLGKTLLAFALLHFVLRDHTCLFLQVSLDFLLCMPVPYDERDFFFFLLLILEGLIGLHRTVKLQLLQQYWSGYRLELLWYWMACLGKEQRSFCHF